MKFIHLSDLHIGRRLDAYSLIEDQKHILNEIINIIKNEHPDGVMIAGDVYDKSDPSEEAVRLFDNFLYELSLQPIEIFIISGNHDSSERLAFCSRIMDKSGIHISPVYDGNISPFKMTDIYGSVNIYMLPFIKPVHVRACFPDEPAGSYTEAIETAVSHMDINEAERNILIAHQFVTGAAVSDSESISVGGLDNVDAAVFSKFDYTALGHIHGPQNIGSNKIRYCGTPLKYSLSEASHEKSVTVVELAAKGRDLTVRTVPLVPLHDVREIEGYFNDIMSEDFYKGTATDDYIYPILTDEDLIPDVMNRLRTVYPKVMNIRYNNTRTRNTVQATDTPDTTGKSPAELFAELYEKQNGRPMSDLQTAFINDLIEEIWEEKHETD
ncbi:MAG: exonuclease SbcCD subunit D [Oscillospiraceae bacterium]|nr:exonuclease SbcCD subunit D [Oscillospiraceae bacterium]